MKVMIMVLYFIFILSGCGSNTSSKTIRNNNIPQTVYPKKVRIGETIELAYTTDDKNIKSYRWWDEDGGLLGTTRKIKWIAPNKSGKYTITLDTIDLNGKKTSASIIINVVNSDKENSKPIITLNGSKEINLQIRTRYSELGATAIDKEDGDITDKIKISGEVDTLHSGSYEIVYSVTDSEGAKSSVKRVVNVTDPASSLNFPAKNFKQIKSMLLAAKNGVLNTPTYIIVGDSTRARSDKEHSELYFENMKQKLSTYNFETILDARGSHTLKQFLDESAFPRLSDVLGDIPNDGEGVIVDFSLGVNDLFALNDENGSKNFMQNRASYQATIEERLKQAINGILKEKPKTTILLVTPNPTRDWEDATQLMLNVYKNVSQELDLPLVDFIDGKMKGGQTTEEHEFDSWYRDPIHFSDKGLNELSSYVLSKILP